MASQQDFVAPLSAALTHALQYLSAVNDGPVAATATLAELRARLDLPLNEQGISSTEVLEELVAGARDGITGNAGPRFFGWVIGGSLPAALAADWMTSTWDQNAGLYACAPAAAVVEEAAGRWLKDLLGLPVEASFALVTGCQLAHATCLAAARNALLQRAGWDVERDGLAGSPAIRILATAEKHSTINRAVRLLGLGEGNIRSLAVDDEGRLHAPALEAALEESPETPTLVVLQAGDVNTGVFDDFAHLLPLAHRYNTWVHVDGAFGLWAAASPRFSHLTRGVEQADSWATDGHKWLNVPYDCGYAFVRDSNAHRASMSARASYLTHAEDARDQLDWNPEFSRRARGFATWAAIRSLGRAGVEDLVNRCCDHALRLTTEIAKLPGAELLAKPTINQGLVRFLDPGPGADQTAHDRHTDRVIAAIMASGEAFFTGTTWRGERAMRISVSNWQTSGEDLERVIRAVADVVQSR